eukprot:superscaffoldBa00002238_g13622
MHQPMVIGPCTSAHAPVHSLRTLPPEHVTAHGHRTPHKLMHQPISCISISISAQGGPTNIHAPAHGLRTSCISTQHLSRISTWSPDLMHQHMVVRPRHQNTLQHTVSGPHTSAHGRRTSQAFKDIRPHITAQGRRT